MATKPVSTSKLQRLKVLLSIMAVAFFFTACGNKGDLYLPEKEPQDQQSDE